MKKIMTLCQFFMLMAVIIPIEGKGKNRVRSSGGYKTSKEILQKVEESLTKISDTYGFNDKYEFIDEEEDKALGVCKKIEKLISRMYAKLIESEYGQMYIIVQQRIDDYKAKHSSVSIPQEFYQARKDAVMKLAETEEFQTFLYLQTKNKYYGYKIACLRHIRHGAGYEPINHYCSSEKELMLAVLNSLKNHPELKGVKPSYSSLEDIVNTEKVYQDVEEEMRDLIDQIMLLFPDI